VSFLRHQLRLIAVAVQYFTRLPVPAFSTFDPAWLSQSARYFPLVGWLVGALCAAALWAFAQVLPMPVACGLSLALGLAITGAFHEDGLADTFDALGGSVPRERALEIMRDSRIGSYGACALVLGLGLRWLLLASLTLPQACLALLVLHPAARAAAAALMARLPYVRDEASKAKPVAQALAKPDLLIALLLGVAPAVVIALLLPAMQPALALSSLCLLICHQLCFRWYRARLGGYTGDALGCAEQLGEIAILLGLVALLATP